MNFDIKMTYKANQNSRMDNQDGLTNQVESTEVLRDRDFG
jgi:hypothetical protein